MSVLHSFNGTDGQAPGTTLTLCGSTLYGTTQYGGSSGDGTVFSVNKDGTDFAVLHSFDDEMGGPQSGLTLCGAKLYGTTYGGGANGWGTVFSINLDGSDYQVVYSFSYTTTNGAGPVSGLTLMGSTLYGMTQYGGSDNCGTVFSVGVDGTDFSLLHSFSESSNNGLHPHRNSLVVHGSTVYGMTPWGGSYEKGTLFSVDVDGSDFQLMHSFGGSGDGSWNFGNLVLKDETLYGSTWGGGGLFSIGTDGTGYSIIHTGGGNSDLTLIDSTLYGTKGGDGSVFSYNIDSDEYNTIYEFGSNPDDGTAPRGGVVVCGSDIYGTTTRGGVNDLGVVFALPIPEPSALILFAFGLVSFPFFTWRRRLM